MIRPIPSLLRQGCLCACLALLAACSPPVPPPSAATPAGKPGPGMVWRVSGGKTGFILAGSFHLLQADDYPLPAAYEIAWRESAHLVLETLPGEASRPETATEIKRLIHLPSGTLPERIAPGTWQELTAWAGRNSHPVETLRTLTPWMAGLTVAVVTADHLGFKKDYGMERHFTARLPGSGKTVEGLETALGQLSLFQQIPPDQQEAMLRQSLTEAGTLAGKAAALTAAWRAGDEAALHQRMSLSFEGFPEVKKLLLDDRNAAWLPRLEALLQGDRPVMVLVGAGHLCGPGSVLELLEAKGYRCVQINAPEPLPLPLPKAA